MKGQLSSEHIDAINRHRRVIVNFDVISADGERFATKEIEWLVEWKFMFADEPGTHIDSIYWSWGEGHQAPYPSEVLPLYDSPGFKKWADDGINIVQVFLEASKQRGIEAFFSYRINGSDNDLGPVAEIPMKEAHPDWLIHTWNANGYWNFAVEGVHEYKLRILREAAEHYDFDGIELDFARVCPVLPPGHQWEYRDRLTDFIRATRAMLLEVGRKRGRPLLLAARIPENLEGCHFDGIDAETWAREELLDIFVMGCRSFDVDIPAFRRITEGTNIKLYPCIDDHHASDGYQWPPIEVMRGVAANWYQQGADGIQTFNFAHANPEGTDRVVGQMYLEKGWETHRQAYHEIGDVDTLKYKDKIFVVQRRGGGHGTTVIPNPEDWSTPRFMYFNTNMFGQLPAPLDNDGVVDTLLTIAVADDVAAEADSVDQITLRLLLSDPEAPPLPPCKRGERGGPQAEGEDQRLQSVTVATIGHPGTLQNVPAAKGIENQIEVRINNILLGTPTVLEGWLVFAVQPKFLAVGDNLVGIRVTERSTDAQGQILIEKLELHLAYR